MDYSTGLPKGKAKGFTRGEITLALYEWEWDGPEHWKYKQKLTHKAFPADIYNGLAIHVTVREGMPACVGPDRFTVSHLQSGLKLGNGYRKYRHAVEIIKGLSEVGSWDISGKDIEANEAYRVAFREVAGE